MAIPTSGSISYGSTHPCIHNRIIALSYVSQRARDKTAPCNHFASSPHRSMPVSAVGPYGTGRRPAIGAWIVSGAVSENAITASAPNNHFGSGPDSGVTEACFKTAVTQCNPTVSNRVVARAVIDVGVTITSAPNNHLAAGPYRRVTRARGWCVDCTNRDPTVRSGIILAPRVLKAAIADILAAPNNHLAAGPDGSMTCAPSRRITHSGRAPGISYRIILTAGIQVMVRLVNVIAPPHDHFGPRPHC